MDVGGEKREAHFLCAGVDINTLARMVRSPDTTNMCACNGF